MVDQELLQAIGQMMDEKLEPINEELKGLREDVEDLKEGQEEIRSGVNVLLAWSEKVSDATKFPLPEII